MTHNLAGTAPGSYPAQPERMNYEDVVAYISHALNTPAKYRVFDVQSGPGIEIRYTSDVAGVVIVHILGLTTSDISPSELMP